MKTNPHLPALAVLFLSLGCSSSEGTPDAGAVADPGLAGDAPADVRPDGPDAPDAAPEVADPAAGEPEYQPRLVRASKDIAPVRGYVVRQGHIHGHGVFSHDACDGHPREGGDDAAKPRDEECFWDLRAALCWNALDFMFMTEHTSGLFCEFDYPEVLYYEPGRGDTLIEHEGQPSANRLVCDDGHSLVLAAGFDGSLMAIGLERHLRDTPAERHALYEGITPALVDELRAHGALTAAAYASDWDRAEIVRHAWDGYEVYNPATNMRARMNEIVTAITANITEPDTSADPELAILAAFEEGTANVDYWWDIALLRPVFNYIGPNAHRNSFPMEMSDGERVDSYRRMFHWFGNFVLIPADQAASADDRTYKAALAAGRLYNAFLFFGYPVGFDFHARSGGAVHEMGTQLPAADGVDLVVGVPRVHGRFPAGTEPAVVTANLLRAIPGGWETVASDTKDFTFRAQRAGVYRVDVRIVPNHLKKWLGADPGPLLTERTWVYSNPIYLGMDYRDPPEPASAGPARFPGEGGR